MEQPVHTKQSLTFKLSLVQFTYFLLCAASQTYCAVYFLSVGFSNSMIGIITAVAHLCGVILQPYITKLEFDLFANNLQKAGLFTGLLTFVCEAIMVLIKGSAPALSAVLYILVIVLYIATQSFISIISIQYENNGYRSNFSLTRGIGSVGYAIGSVLASRVIAVYAAPSIPVMSSICAVLHAVTFLLLPTVGEMEYCIRPSKDSRGGIEPFFYMLLFATCLLYSSHNILGSYLYQILDYYQEDVTVMGNLEFISATLELPAMMLVPLLWKKFGSRRVLTFAGFFFFLKALLTFLVMNVNGLFILRFLQPFSYALYTPMLVYFTNEALPEYQRARGQVLASQFYFAASVTASVLGGFIIDLFGVPVLLISAAVLGASGLLLLIFSFSKKKAR